MVVVYKNESLFYICNNFYFILHSRIIKMMLSIENCSSPFLQDTGPCTVLPSFTDDLICGLEGPDPEVNLSLALELIEAEERTTYDMGFKRSDSMDAKLSEIVDIISKNTKTFPLSGDLPTCDTLLESNNILESNVLLSDFTTDEEMLSEPFSPTPSPDMMTSVISRIPFPTTTQPIIKAIPEEERPSIKYPHILSTLQGTYKGFSTAKPLTKAPATVHHPIRTTTVHTIPTARNNVTHTIIPSTKANLQTVTVVKPQIATLPTSSVHIRPTTSRQGFTAISNSQTLQRPITLTRPAVTVTKPNIPTITNITQVTSVISNPILSNTTAVPTPVSIPQASVPSLPPPIGDQRYVMVPQTTLNTKVVLKKTSSVEPSGRVVKMNTQARRKATMVHRDSNSDTSATMSAHDSTSEDEYTGTNILLPLVVRDEEVDTRRRNFYPNSVSIINP